jgi:hypothetical protein
MKRVTGPRKLRIASRLIEETRTATLVYTARRFLTGPARIAS